MRRQRVFGTTESAELRWRWRSRTAAWGWYSSGVALLIVAGVLVQLTASEVHRLTRVLPPPPPEVTNDLVIRNVADEAGRRATFRILLLTDEFRWRLASYRQLTDGAHGLQFSDEMKQVLNDAEEVICVGTSSEELPRGVTATQGRRAEERRAARRAEQIAVWVRSQLAKPIPVRKLNVGHHAPTGRLDDTSEQRRVVIILVLDRDEHVNVDQALRAAMRAESGRAPVFDTLLTRYSLTGGPELSWVD
jgi:hypothetical protein